jgi:hypothetical protein
MRWEIKNNKTQVGDIRFKTKFAFLPTRVRSTITNTDHLIWLELYIEEQEYVRSVHYDAIISEWVVVDRTIHI